MAAPKIPVAKAKSLPARGMNPMLAGIIIGLMLGMLIALGVAVWMNRSSASAFIDKTTPVAPLPLARPPISSASAPGGQPSSKPKFEFYELLPGDKNTAGKKAAESSSPVATESAAPPTPPPTTAAAATPPAQATPPAAAPEQSYLQIGAFQKETDADNLKAKIAFIGLEASVRPVNVAGKGTLFRVRLGPFRTVEELNRAKLALSQNGIASNPAKAD